MLPPFSALRDPSEPEPIGLDSRLRDLETYQGMLRKAVLIVGAQAGIFLSGPAAPVVFPSGSPAQTEPSDFPPQDQVGTDILVPGDTTGQVAVWDDDEGQYLPDDPDNLGYLPLAGGTLTGPIFWPVDTPAQIVANQNNYVLGSGRFQRLSSDASRNITGIVATAMGDERTLVNVGAFNIVLTHLDAASSAANQFLTSTALSLTVVPNGTAIIFLDSVTAKWRARLA